MAVILGARFWSASCCWVAGTYFCVAATYRKVKKMSAKDAKDWGREKKAALCASLFDGQKYKVPATPPANRAISTTATMFIHLLCPLNESSPPPWQSPAPRQCKP